MTDTPRYPPLTDVSLVPFRAIEAQLKQFPDLLDRPDCPYNPSVKSFLRRFAGETPIAIPEEGAMDDDDLVTETAALYRRIQTTSQSTQATDAKDQAQIFKILADLLGKLITLREKAMNVRSMSQFQRSVIEVLETVVTPAQRSEFIEKLGKHLDVQ